MTARTIDPSGTLFDGTRVDGPVALRKMLIARPETFVGVMTEKLLTYALGRGLDVFGHAGGAEDRPRRGREWVPVLVD